LLESHRLKEEAWSSVDLQLTEAMARLWMVYQPIVSWSQRSLMGYEALVRSASMTLSNPVLLFEAAERLGRVRELGRCIRRQIAFDIEDAPGQALIFVNLHALELGDDDLFEQTSELGRFSRRVVLEVTERSSLENVVDVGSRVARLRELGYRVAVDDLGAGYAGLTSFSQLEPDVAKLDMSLVRDIDSSKRKQSLVRSMVNVCERELGVQVVCEGVETEAERDTLESLGGTLLQGYLFGRPAPGFSPVQFLSTDSVVGDG
jgi:EAL domain-containing protein (putative c-di-GMP-specific phosphodiesterase class I)